MVSSICQEGGSGVVSGVLGFAGVLVEGEVEVEEAGGVGLLGLEEVEEEVLEEGAPGSGKGEVITNCSTFSN